MIVVWLYTLVTYRNMYSLDVDTEICLLFLWCIHCSWYPLNLLSICILVQGSEENLLGNRLIMLSVCRGPSWLPGNCIQMNWTVGFDLWGNDCFNE